MTTPIVQLRFVCALGFLLAGIAPGTCAETSAPSAGREARPATPGAGVLPNFGVRAETSAPLHGVNVAAIDRTRILKAANAALKLEPITITAFRAKLSEGKRAQTAASGTA